MNRFLQNYVEWMIPGLLALATGVLFWWGWQFYECSGLFHSVCVQYTPCRFNAEVMGVCLVP